ncbi:MAG: potassium-transporting ATPase subunit C [Bacteroidetes bacterium]|nr:MAG: potassium-transporting ATPase subunit C [Bacteroidota bacterium]
MKQHILPAIRLTAICIIFFCVVYPAFIWLVALASPGHGDGERVSVENRVVGYAKIGQSFTEDKYFWGRPSAVGYNAAASGGSNKGPSNPDYLKDVQSRIDSFLLHNPGVKTGQIPSELVTASGSGQDPDLSPAGAYIQAARIAKARGISQDKINALIDRHIDKPLLSLMGPEKVNVLLLNIDLDKLK